MMRYVGGAGGGEEHTIFRTRILAIIELSLESSQQTTTSENNLGLVSFQRSFLREETILRSSASSQQFKADLDFYI